MSDDNFKTVMSKHSDESLIKVLKERNRYTKEARDAAIEEAVKREILLHKDYVDEVYPLKIEVENIEFGINSRKTLIDFKKNILILYAIGIGTWIFSFIMQGIIFPIIPIVYLGLIFYCSIKFNQALINLIIWGAIIQIVSVIAYTISNIFL